VQAGPLTNRPWPVVVEDDAAKQLSPLAGQLAIWGLEDGLGRIPPASQAD